ncbi:MAG: hypothetical protein ACFFG0_26065 [Candidatus Thorarchaeota archaeon]
MKNKIKIQAKWEVQFKKPVYSCSISNILGDQLPEIIGCSFDETMRIYNLQGKQVMISEFSSKITTFLVAPVTSDEDVELVSGDINGIVRLLGKQGNLIWNINLKSPIICSDIGDFLGNGKNEIVLGLQNNKLIFLNERGQIIEVFQAPDGIKDCTIIEKSNYLLGNLTVLLKDGKIINFDKNGRWQEVFQLNNDPICIKYNKVFGNQVLIIGYKNGVLKLSDFEGYILGETSLNNKIRSVNRYLPVKDDNYNNFIVVAAGNSLYLFQLFKTNKQIEGTTIKKLTKPSDEIISIKTAPIMSNESINYVTMEHIDKNAENNQIQNVNDQPKFIQREKIKKYAHGEGVKIQRGGQIEGSKYVFKIKVVNEREYNVTDVNVQILSYPEESLTLIREKEEYESRTTSPDRVKIHKLTKGGFFSPQFLFLPKTDCVKGNIQAVINFLNASDEIETIIMEPYEIKVICGLLQPNPITVEEFDKFSQDIINFQKVGEEVEVLIEAGQLYEKLLVILETKNFFIVDTEKQMISDKLFGSIKACAKGTYSKNKLGLQITLTGIKNSKKSILKIETFSQDIDMSPALINEIENSITTKKCPECNYDIPQELLRRILQGKVTYCENCGASLLD